MSIESKIKAIAGEQFPGYSYVFEDWNGAYEVLDRVTLPAIICILPVGGTMELKNGMVKDSEEAILAFVDKVQRDADGSDNEAVYTAMKDAASGFLKAINASHYFEPVERVTYKTLLESGAAYLSGVFVELTLKELQGRCV